MTPGILSTSPTVGSGSDASSTAAVPNSTVTMNDFMQLLVAQLENQDPLSPADGTQFLTQLAQFTQLQQTQSISTDVTAIRQDTDQLTGQSTSATGNS